MAVPRSIVLLWLTALFSLNASVFVASEAVFVVKGRVYCDACDAGGFTKSSSYLRDAKVAVQCTSREGAKTAYVEGRTNKDGVFKIKVAGEHEHDLCVAALRQSSSQACNLLTEKSMATLKLSKKKLPNTVVQAGPFSFKPVELSSACASQRQQSASHLDSYYTPTPFPPYTPSPVAHLPSSPSPVCTPPTPYYKLPFSSSPVHTPFYEPPSSRSPNQKPPCKPPSSSSPFYRLLYSTSRIRRPPYKTPSPPPPVYYNPPSPNSSSYYPSSSPSPSSVYDLRSWVLVEVCCALLLRFMHYC